MGRTFIDQPTQIFHSDNYDDAFATGVQLVSSSQNIEDDLNALRTQVRRLLWAGATGSWYDSVLGVANLTPARGLNTVNSALSTVENQKFIYDIQSLGYVVVPSGSNFVSLSVSGSTAPSGLAAPGYGIATGSFTGSLVALLDGQAGVAHSLNLISGTSAITPRNLVVVRDAYTHLAFTDPTHGNHEVYGLLQINSGAVDGTPFSDSDPGETQISFVVEYPSGSFVPASTTAIGGKIINYQYRFRTTYLNLPEDAYTNTVFVDVIPLISSNVQFSDITLQNAINNQGNTVVTDAFNTEIQLGSGAKWTFSAGMETMFSVVQATDSVLVGAGNLDVTSATSNFANGLSIATGSGNTLSLFNTPGVISSVGGMFLTPGGNLGLDAGLFLQFSDQYGTAVGSGSINFANAQSEWNSFYNLFGNISLLKALDNLSSSLSSSYVSRSRLSAGVNVATLSPNVNVTYPTNLDGPLLNYAGRDFVNDVEVYLNGVLCMPGTSAGSPNDVYPGTSPATGDIKFPMRIRSGSIISMVRF